MICYRDMTFCADAETCPKREGCARHFGQEEESKAIKWWGSKNMPVAFSSMAATCKRLNEDSEKGIF